MTAPAGQTRIVRVIVKGQVQGVGFRAFVEREAGRRQIEGWVRNRRDGAVEAGFAGTEQAVADMIAVCRQGPRAARVDDLEIEAADRAAIAERLPGQTFSVLPTK